MKNFLFNFITWLALFVGINVIFYLIAVFINFDWTWFLPIDWLIVRIGEFVLACISLILLLIINKD